MAPKRNAIQTYIALERDEYNRLAAYAKLEGTTIGELLAQLAREYLNKHDELLAPLKKRSDESSLPS